MSQDHAEMDSKVGIIHREVGPPGGGGKKIQSPGRGRTGQRSVKDWRLATRLRFAWDRWTSLFSSSTLITLALSMDWAPAAVGGAGSGSDSRLEEASSSAAVATAACDSSLLSSDSFSWTKLHDEPERIRTQTGSKKCAAKMLECVRSPHKHTS